jgi:hypothetical protein
MSELQKGTKDTLQNYKDLNVKTTISVTPYCFINIADCHIYTYM